MPPYSMCFLLIRRGFLPLWREWQPPAVADPCGKVFSLARSELGRPDAGAGRDCCANPDRPRVDMPPASNS